MAHVARSANLQTTATGHPGIGPEHWPAGVVAVAAAAVEPVDQSCQRDCHLAVAAVGAVAASIVLSHQKDRCPAVVGVAAASTVPEHQRDRRLAAVGVAAASIVLKPQIIHCLAVAAEGSAARLTIQTVPHPPAWLAPLSQTVRLMVALEM